MVYVDFINNRLVAWEYSTGAQTFLYLSTFKEIKAYAKKWNCKITVSDIAKLHLKES